MRNGSRTTATIGITGLSATLVVVALAMTGGPIHARKEYRDNIRMQDLRAISQQVSCSVSDSKRPLPDTPKPVPGCGNMPRMQDPYTDRPYRYEVLDQRSLRLCAEFELPPDPHMQSGDETLGDDPMCRDFRIWRPDGVAEPQTGEAGAE